jgi:hypothetical protein
LLLLLLLLLLLVQRVVVLRECWVGGAMVVRVQELLKWRQGDRWKGG